MRVFLLAAVTLLPFSSASQPASPVRMLDPVPHAPGSNTPARIKDECSDLGHEIAFMVNGLARGSVQLVKGTLPIKGPGAALQLEITDVHSAGNAFLGQDQGIALRGTLYRDGARVAGFVARRTNQADNLLSACANLDSLAPNLARDITRWLKDPKDGAELGRSWF